MLRNFSIQKVKINFFYWLNILPESIKIAQFSTAVWVFCFNKLSPQRTSFDKYFHSDRSDIISSWGISVKAFIWFHVTALQQCLPVIGDHFHLHFLGSYKSHMSINGGRGRTRIKISLLGIGFFNLLVLTIYYPLWFKFYQGLNKSLRWKRWLFVSNIFILVLVH